jgi:hypothetical protein
MAAQKVLDASSKGNHMVSDAEFLEHDLEKDLAQNVDAHIRNPLAGLTEAELDSQATIFCERYGFNDDLETFKKAARVAQRPEAFEEISSLTEEDKYHIRRETTRQCMEADGGNEIADESR